MIPKVHIEYMGQEEWESRYSCFCDANYQQSWAYADAIAERHSACHEEVGFWLADTLVGLASVRVRRIPILGFGLAYVAGGPLVGRGTAGDLERFRFCLKALCDEYVMRRGLVLRILAPIGDTDWNDRASSAFTSLGFAVCSDGRAYRTSVLNLQRSLDEIRSSLAQKWRNCLNKAEKQGLEVEWTNDALAFEGFQKAHRRFVAGKGFEVELDGAFYLEVRRRSLTDPGLNLALVGHDGEIIAGHMGSYWGDTAVYLLGFTDERGLHVNASYLLQWAVIKRSHELGFKWYDLGGIDPIANPGVHRFKSGLGGVELSAAGPAQFVRNHLDDYVLRGLKTARKAFMRI